VEAAPDGPGTDPQAKGFRGAGPAGYRYYIRHFVNGRRQRIGLEAAYTRGPVAFKAEGLQAREERIGQGSTFGDLPEQVANGWAVSGTWLVTGEKKARTVKPRRRLFRGPGALELAVRVDGLHFDDNGPSTGFEGAGNRARNIRPAAANAFTGGLSWWPTEFLRFMGNVVVRDGRQSAGHRNYVTVLGRVQVHLP
jgi:phosphate-selective porin